MENNAVTEKKIPSSFIYFFGSFGGILFGYDIGVMTGALPFLQNDWEEGASRSRHELRRRPHGPRRPRPPGHRFW